MYFPNLENLKTKLNDELVINFDSWLGTMAPLYSRKINATDYAVKEKIDLYTCISLFDMAVKYKVLMPRIVVIDDFGSNHGTFRNNKDIPTEVMNYEYNQKVVIEERNKEIIYELIERPKQQAALDNHSRNSSQYLGSGTLTLDTLRKSNAAASLDVLGADF